MRKNQWKWLVVILSAVTILLTLIIVFNFTTVIIPTGKGSVFKSGGIVTLDCRDYKDYWITDCSETNNEGFYVCNVYVSDMEEDAISWYCRG